MRILDTPRATVGESPVWDDATARLWWVDVRGPALFRTDPRTVRTEAWALPEPVGSLALCRSGALLLALRRRVARFDPLDGRLETVAAPEAGRPHNRLNDGKASPCGRFVVGGMDDRPDKHPTAALWCVHADGGATRLMATSRDAPGQSQVRPDRVLVLPPCGARIARAWAHGWRRAVDCLRPIIRQLPEASICATQHANGTTLLQPA